MAYLENVSLDTLLHIADQLRTFATSIESGVGFMKKAGKTEMEIQFRTAINNGIPRLETFAANVRTQGELQAKRPANAPPRRPSRKPKPKDKG